MSNISLDFERTLWKDGLQYVAGIDEAGRGPLAGPVVAAAVIFPPETIIEGVDDSKNLPEKKREELYPIIMEQAVGVGIGVVDHTTIDQINILQATHRAMEIALQQLQAPAQYVLVDGNSFGKSDVPYKTIIDGDALSFTIAAASIVAKVTRDRMMREYDKKFPEYGFAQHKGYGTRFHREAILKYGLCEIHRRTFCKSLGDRENIVAE
ncbi:MAG TPA: ribonuclease HII [Bacteroidota bacterium]|nr:ribonuclease HII [Bacteroidota bacterium]